MIEQKSEELGRELEKALDSGKLFLKELSQIKSGSARIKIGVAGTAGTVVDPGGPGISACTAVITGDTPEDAYKMAKMFEAIGCVCMSSGEKEVICQC